MLVDEVGVGPGEDTGGDQREQHRRLPPAGGVDEFGHVAQGATQRIG